MADPLLSSLCRICHINPPKYTCPRCSLQTCSLPCSRRHKLWASCSGVRDPTVFKPISQIATPSGIDHDYNFLHSIEHKIERSAREIVEERGLVRKSELEHARLGFEPTRKGPRRISPGVACIARRLREMNLRVDKAPKGMKRSLENSTRWSRKARSIQWQVEWIREGDGGRTLFKLSETRPLEAYHEILEDETRGKMTTGQKAKNRKRKAKVHLQRMSKRAKLDQQSLTLTTIPILQDPKTTRWSISAAEAASLTEALLNEITESGPTRQQYHFYLLRPHTPAIFPKVLAPLDSSQPLSKLLQNRVILEFPTIYVLKTPPEELPETYMLEKDFCRATGQGRPLAMAGDESDEEEGYYDDDEDDDSTSDSSSEASGSELEEGEIK